MYPQTIPSESIKNVISIIRSGEIADKKAELLHDLWYVQGYIQSVVFGDPGVVSTQSVADFEAVATLEKLISEDPQAHGLIPWELLLNWIVNYIIEVLLTQVK